MFMVDQHRSEVRGRVQTGARFLDEVRPGWRERIDTRTLDISDGNHCILGQLYGSYRAGLLHMGCSVSHRCRSLGFLANNYLENQLLTEEWKLALNA